MPDPKKQEYYRKNREKRLAYQRAYYARSKAKRAREKELLLLLEPEKWHAKQERRKAYYRAYYAKNGDRIRAQRKAKRREAAEKRKREQP